MSDPNPGVDSTGEQVDVLELEPTDSEKTAQGGDPLDDIQDPGARAEAKKYRAIARRAVKKPVVAAPADAPAPAVDTPKPAESEFLTKADFYKSNERKARLLAEADPEVKANFDKILPYYTPRNGKETPEDILEDLKDAITVFKSRNPIVETDDSKRDLTVTAVVKTGGGGPVSQTAPKTAQPPNYKLPTQPSDWYKKPEAPK